MRKIRTAPGMFFPPGLGTILLRRRERLPRSRSHRVKILHKWPRWMRKAILANWYGLELEDGSTPVLRLEMKT